MKTLGALLSADSSAGENRRPKSVLPCDTMWTLLTSGATLDSDAFVVFATTLQRTATASHRPAARPRNLLGRVPYRLPRKPIPFLVHQGTCGQEARYGSAAGGENAADVATVLSEGPMVQHPHLMPPHKSGYAANRDTHGER